MFGQIHILIAYVPYAVIDHRPVCHPGKMHILILHLNAFTVNGKP